MANDFYKNLEYKKKQSRITKENWRKGIFNFYYKREKRKCARTGCSRIFETILSSQKIYCSQSCSTKVNNLKRDPPSEETKLKVSKSLRGKRNPFKGIIKVPRIKTICANPYCRKVFLRERWTNRKFCSNKCAIKVIGGRPTSPRAARGKAGAREDVNRNIYFYSRWEANVARLFNYLDVKWFYQPKTFYLGSQNYTPDFYLPEQNTYIEVKNFLWKYSEVRDKKFRKIYPDENLILLLKEDYLKLEKRYSKLINNWEYKNSPFLSERVIKPLNIKK